MTAKPSAQMACSVLIASALTALCPAVSAAPGPAEAGLKDILNYIGTNWDALTRTMTSCGSVQDSKLDEPAWLYLPAGLAEPESVRRLEQTCRVRVGRLPAQIERPGQLDPAVIGPQGLLYLPNSYVVPGGRFNEMYGWDSYFIILGLLRDGRLDLARGMVENFFFEIENYGTVLNANRTYYLTRSQPPFLTSMILAVYQADLNAGRAQPTWLERAYALAEREYGFWTTAPHLAGATGLSRYYDFGGGPAPESLKDETGFYAKVASYFLTHPDPGHSYVVAADSATPSPDGLAVRVCDGSQRCASADPIELSPDYYKGDRSMRESGFDVSFRFGPYGAATHHFAPVCLNSLLYKTERDLEEMARRLGRAGEAAAWKRRAEKRRLAMTHYLWDEKAGLFFDYDTRSGARSSYAFAAAFYPLWVGLASPAQAEAVARNLPLFETAGGLAASPRKTGAQWDFPYGWAPLQLIAVEGLRRYGRGEDADRVAFKFLSTVAQSFRREGTIREKYDVAARSSQTRVTMGYQANVIGFGWTNGVFLELLHALSPELVARLAEAQPTGPRPD
jgi:alpha,alpha-trehalase